MGDTPAQIAESKYILVGGANPEGCLKDNPFGGRKKTGKIIIVFNANSIGIGAQCLAGIGKAAAQTDVDQCTLLSLKEQQQLGRNYEEYAQHTSKEGGEHVHVGSNPNKKQQLNVTILSHLNPISKSDTFFDEAHGRISMGKFTLEVAYHEAGRHMFGVQM